MYEAIVVKKQRPRSIAGTPLAKLSVIATAVLLSVPLTYAYFLSKSLDKRREIILELDEYKKKYAFYEELHKTQSFWKDPLLLNSVALAIKLTKEKEESNTSTESSSSTLDIPKANN